MLLEGSCHCGAVHFRLRSRHPYPFNLCYCSICRKTAGGGGFADLVFGVREGAVVSSWPVAARGRGQRELADLGR